ncbi:CRNN protein, partial [Stercorarius parasiticus]|nr:CRNN protein [Stercorarius parasiticus]
MAQPEENIHDIGAPVYLCVGSDGNCSPLSREELRQLIEQEFEDAMENAQDPKTVKTVLRFLDDDSNRRVDFSELLSLVFRTAKACYKPLQPGQGQEDGQEPTEEEKAGGEQPSRLHAAGRVSRNQQVPKQGVNNQVQDTDNHQTQEGETPEEDQDTHQNQEGERPKQDQDTRQNQEGETPKQDRDNHQTQEGETPQQDGDNRQAQEGETKEQNRDNHQDDRTGASEGDPERGEILDTATSEQKRNTHKAEETKSPKQDPKTHQAKKTEAPGQGSNHHQNPETESSEQDLNCPSETQGRDPKNKTQVCDAPQQDPNPDKTQKLLPPQQGAGPCQDPKPWGTHHDPAFHWVLESKVLEQEHSGAEAPSCPAQPQQDTHQHKQPPIEQQVLQSLYQWPPQQ